VARSQPSSFMAQCMLENGLLPWLEHMTTFINWHNGLTGEKVVEYMTNELATKYGSDKDITAFMDKFDFYMFPIVNVDGAHPDLCSPSSSNTVLTMYINTIGRLQIHSVSRPHVAQESSANFREQLSWTRHQPQLALPVGWPRFVHQPLCRRFPRVKSRRRTRDQGFVWISPASEELPRAEVVHRLPLLLATLHDA
jgi:hypothetical protein